MYKLLFSLLYKTQGCGAGNGAEASRQDDATRGKISLFSLFFFFSLSSSLSFLLVAFCSVRVRFRRSNPQPLYTSVLFFFFILLLIYTDVERFAPPLPTRPEEARSPTLPSPMCPGAARRQISLSKFSFNSSQCGH